MVLEWLNYKLDGNKWEELCIEICRIYYKKDDFHEVPANYKGDGGIEGFTKSELGVVIQCYCPSDENRDNDSLYKAQRDKVTEDIDKIINNHEILKGLGVPKISKWIFMVPEYRDKRILQHCQVKQEMIIQAKIDNPDELSLISEDFKIIIRVAADYKTEIARLIRCGITDIKLDVPELDDCPIDWSEVDSEKSDNIIRKMKAVSPTINSNAERMKKLIDFEVKKYIQGKVTMEYFCNEYREIWEDIKKVESVFKRDVQEKCMMLDDNKMNLDLYHQLSDEFSQSLSSELDYLSESTINLIKQSIVASWLADCHMEFY
ncbi:hypothetical protein [Vagococcus fessus]|uniref:Uncharacterized protein n=1 Tax=Vagococcus fessus TaxID=120370 RepID=A0A430ABS3_9ENTE|nr:hypothetical protein [Vagococcus fessus]RSU04660.1 hypothetical protein CBF31_01180 [Vagococcus fessus]